jgi:hypothetical protein
MSAEEMEFEELRRRGMLPEPTITKLVVVESPPEDRALTTALELARLGHPVFPLRPTTIGEMDSGKAPATPNGVKDAIDDLDRIVAWGEEKPDHNWGIALENGRLIVIEVDPYQGGSLHALAEIVGRENITVVRVSGRGFHVYAREMNVANGEKLGKGMTVRSDGYYAVAPGSLH